MLNDNKMYKLLNDYYSEVKKDDRFIHHETIKLMEELETTNYEEQILDLKNEVDELEDEVWELGNEVDELEDEVRILKKERETYVNRHIDDTKFLTELADFLIDMFIEFDELGMEPTTLNSEDGRAINNRYRNVILKFIKEGKMGKNSKYQSEIFTNEQLDEMAKKLTKIAGRDVTITVKKT